MRSPKVFAISFQYVRPIPRPASPSHNRRMDPLTLDETERAQREIDDLLALIRNKELQISWLRQHNQHLRVKLNRYEAILGMEEAA